MKSVQTMLEAALFFVFVGLFKVLGLAGASWFGGWFASTVGPLTPYHQAAVARVRRAMPALDNTQADHIIRNTWRNLGRTMGELPHLDRFSLNGPDPRLTLDGGETLHRVLSEGKGAIFISGHFANWEVMPIVLKNYDVEAGEVYRAPNNTIVDNWLTDQRRTNVAPIQIPKGAAGAKDLISLIRAKGVVAMLVDQKMNDGIEVPLMGLPAMSPPAAAQLHLRYGMPLVPAGIERLEGSRFHVTVFDPIEIEPTGDRAQDSYEIMRRINGFLEERIRERPHEWLWLHKRWPEPKRKS